MPNSATIQEAAETETASNIERGKGIRIEPHPGPQYNFLKCYPNVDIVIYGGGRGGGKSYALLMEGLRHFRNSYFGGVIFRRTYPEIFGEGGLWDTSELLYPLTGARGSRGNCWWQWPSGAKVTFSHMENEKDRFNWLGRRIPFIGFDELPMFTEKQFWFMLSSSGCPDGSIVPYIRATANPEADHWLARLISWWWNPDTGYAIDERSGVVRWFVRVHDELIWGENREELLLRYPGNIPRSLTFIKALLGDNPTLERNDPTYRANLMALTTVERERYLYGNWKVRPSAGLYFKREWFQIVERADVPESVKYNRLRYWDRAATEKRPDNDPDFTWGVKVSKDSSGHYYIEDGTYGQATAGAVETMIKNTASQEQDTVQYLEQDPAQAGKVERYHLTNALAKYVVQWVPATRKSKTDTEGKFTHVKHASATAENLFKIGTPIKMVRAPWNEALLSDLEGFPDSSHDDGTRAFCGAMNAHRDGKFQCETIVVRRPTELSGVTSRRNKGLIW